jgi:hypothetical protein
MSLFKSSRLILFSLAVFVIFLRPSRVLGATATIACPTDNLLQCQSTYTYPFNIAWLGTNTVGGQIMKLGNGIITQIGIMVRGNGSGTPATRKMSFKMTKYPSMTSIASTSFDFTWNNPVDDTPQWVDVPLNLIVSSGSYFAGVMDLDFTGGTEYSITGTQTNSYIGYAMVGGTSGKNTPIVYWSDLSPADTGFYVQGIVTGGGWQIVPTPPPTVTCGGTDYTCQLTQWLVTSFQNMITWLFVPDPLALQEFSGLWDKVKLKPPIGYFTTTKTAFDNLTTASGSYYLTFSGLDSGDSPLKTLKIGLTWILWFMVGFWIIHRIRLLEV